MEKIGFEESLDILAERLKKLETGRISSRENERQLELGKKKEEKEQSAAINEKLQLFVETFNGKRQEIEEALNIIASGSLDKTDLPYHFDKIVKSIQSLQNYISSSSYFIRVYDVRKSQEALQGLQQKCVELEERLLPKKKFSFKSRKIGIKSKKETFGCKIEDCVDSPPVPVPTITKPPVLSENLCGFSQRIGENLILKEEMIFKKDVILSNLENCTVRLPGVPSTLHMANLNNTRVLCGPVITSVFIEDCVDSVFVLACQQMRIHNTQHCDFYLHVTSRAIIEDTKEVKFAPYVWKYENADSHFQLAGLDMNRNNWDLIDDFNWLACDKPSPHWKIMKANEQNLDWI